MSAVWPMEDRGYTYLDMQSKVLRKVLGYAIGSLDNLLRLRNCAQLLKGLPKVGLGLDLSMRPTSVQFSCAPRAMLLSQDLIFSITSYVNILCLKVDMLAMNREVCRDQSNPVFTMTLISPINQ